MTAESHAEAAGFAALLPIPIDHPTLTRQLMHYYRSEAHALYQGQNLGKSLVCLGGRPAPCLPSRRVTFDAGTRRSGDYSILFVRRLLRKDMAQASGLADLHIGCRHTWYRSAVMAGISSFPYCRPRIPPAALLDLAGPHHWVLAEPPPR